MTTAAFEATGSPPIPEPNELTRFYWDAVDEHRLELLRCQNCGHYIHYPQPICNRCGSAAVVGGKAASTRSRYGSDGDVERLSSTSSRCIGGPRST